MKARLRSLRQRKEASAAAHPRAPSGHPSLRGIAAIVFATAIWGHGFVASVDALRVMGPMWLTGLRFLLPAILAIPILALWRTKGAFAPAQIRLAILPAFALATMMVLQTWGLTHTSVTNSGFITTLYVVFVPLLEVLILGRRMSWWHGVCVALALVGTALMCGWHAGRINLGDIATLGAALLAAWHLLLIEKVAAKTPSAFAFNTLQSGFSALFLLPIAMLFEAVPKPVWDPAAAFGLLWLVVFSTMIGFALQVRAQRQISPSLASLLFLLESPFAALSAWIFLGDAMSVVQLIGGALILLAAAAAVSIPQFKLLVLRRMKVESVRS